jgi:hypothetical protein
MIARLLTSKWEGLQGYLGAWPNPGFLKLFSMVPGSGPDPNGYSRLLTGLWQRQTGPFTLISYHPEIIDQTVPQLRFEKAPRPAQVWFKADDLAHSKLAPMLNAYGYRQSKQITRSNTKYMNMLSEQLHVPPTECRATAEQLLAAKMISPLGGDYELRELPGGLKTWVSTALADRGDTSQPPADYEFPALNWLRGIDFELTTQNGMLSAHGEVIMPVETRPAPKASPLGGLLGGAIKPGPTPTDKANGDKKPVVPENLGPAKPGPTPAKPTLKVPAPPAPSDVKPTGKKAF